MGYDGGYIKLHRKIKKWEWYHDLNVRVTFIHCLLSANWEDKKFEGEVIKRGSFVTSKKKLAEEVGISLQSLKTALSKLQLTEVLTISPRAKNSLFIVKNYDLYQVANQVSNHELTNDQPTTNQRLTTTEEYKEYKELNNNTVVDIDSNKYINTTHVRAREENSTKNSIENSTATEGLAFVPLPGEPGDDRPESVVSQIIQAVEDSFVRTVSPTEIMTLKSWLEDIPADVIIMAIQEAAKSNVKNVAYVEGVLRSWRSNGVKSVEDAKEQQRIYASRIRNKQQQKANTSIEQKPIVKKKRGFVMDENGEY